MNEKELLGKYCLVLGLEIHLHLKTGHKMFCGCSADIWEKDPNSVVCPTCLALPGALPVPNFEAIEKMQLLALGLNCTLNKDSRFDRKHYFYPDLPKGYQISQYKQPFAINGKLDLQSGNIADIERVHLEEDVAKSFHEGGKTLLDFNKSGMPLVEIVTRPCFKNIDDAVDFCKQVQTMVRYLGIGDVDMEKGQMRLEANISLRTKKQEEKNELPPYKVEVKNINSFRFMEKAVRSEIARQKEILDEGKTPVQENRGYKEGVGTVAQRSKEEAHDYRYFPEPDIPPMVFDDKYIDSLKHRLPELPAQIRKRLVEQYGISNDSAWVLVETLGLEYVKKMEEVVKLGVDGKSAANAIVNKAELRNLPADEIAGKLKTVKEVTDETQLAELVKKVILENPKAAEDYKKGKETAIQYLVGAMMKEIGGKADANAVKKEILHQLL